MERHGDCWGVAEEQKHELSHGRLWPSGEQGALWESCGADESAQSIGQAIAAKESVVTRISLKYIVMMLAARRAFVDRGLSAILMAPLSKGCQPCRARVSDDHAGL